MAGLNSGTLDVDCWIDRNRAVVEIRGEADVRNSSRLCAVFEDLPSPARYRMVVDLSGTDFIDSSGLGVLIGAAKRARTGGGRLILVSPRQNVLKMLQICGLLTVMPVCDSVEDAFAALA